MDSDFIILTDLNYDDDLFRKEFNNLKNIFPMDNCRDVYQFLNDNRGIIIILNHVKPLLDEYVPYSKVKLILDVDSLFVPQLQLHIRAPKHNFKNGFKEDIRKINLLIRPLLLKFDLGKEFFIFDGLYG